MYYYPVCMSTCMWLGPSYHLQCSMCNTCTCMVWNRYPVEPFQKGQKTRGGGGGGDFSGRLDLAYSINPVTMNW